LDVVRQSCGIGIHTICMTTAAPVQLKDHQ
jgi:hypothetical protein